MLELQTRHFIDKKLKKVWYKLESNQVIFELPISNNWYQFFADYAYFYNG